MFVSYYNLLSEVSSTLRGLQNDPCNAWRQHQHKWQLHFDIPTTIVFHCASVSSPNSYGWSSEDGEHLRKGIHCDLHLWKGYKSCTSDLVTVYHQLVDHVFSAFSSFLGWCLVVQFAIKRCSIWSECDHFKAKELQPHYCFCQNGV